MTDAGGATCWAATNANPVRLQVIAAMKRIGLAGPRRRDRVTIFFTGGGSMVQILVEVLVAIGTLGWPANGVTLSQQTDAADALIRRGVQLRKAGDDRGAHDDLQRAYDLEPSPRAAAQLGLVEQALSRWDDADTHLSEAVRSTGSPWVEKNRRVLEKALILVRAHVATVLVTGEPQGADVYVNGRQLGRLPLREPVRVIAGEVDVEVRADGYKRNIQKLTVEPFQYRPLVVRLERIGVTAAPSADAAAQAPTTTAPGTSSAGGALAVPISPPSELAGARPRTEAWAADSPAVSATAEPPFATSVSAAAPSSETDHPGGWTTRSVVGWSTSAVGVAAAAIGVGEVVLGRSKMSDAVVQANRANSQLDMGLQESAQRDYEKAQGDFSSGVSQRNVGILLLAIGGAATATGLVVALTAPGSDPPPVAAARLAPWIWANVTAQAPATGVSWSGSW